MAQLTLNEALSVTGSANVAAFKTAGKITTGRIINERLAKIVGPKLPMMVRGYASTPLGQAVMGNILAMALIKFYPGNDKVQLAADCMITAGAVDIVDGFEIEKMVNELLDGIDLSAVKDEA